MAERQRRISTTCAGGGVRRGARGRTAAARRLAWAVAGILTSLLVLSGCSEDSSPPQSESQPDPVGSDSLVESGRSVYNANCIACHNLDPTQPGSLGPVVAGASLALVEARVLRAEYPEGYVPKQNTRAMVPLPHLESRLPELMAYLGSL